MTRSIWTLALLWLALTVAPAAAERNARDRHLRSAEPELVDLIAVGVRTSPTLRRLVDRVEASDVVVYVTFDRSPSPHAGHIALMSTVPGRRYLRISLDRRYLGCQRLALLGHELQHAVEIADAPWVIDHESVASLYKSIGFRSDNGHTDCYDSRLAIETGRQIQRETMTAASWTGVGASR
jgi:hypothetical protein